jgi:Icc-related predicted phosphoesterase
MLDGHAFFADDPELVRAWSRIPEETDVLITHTPPGGILDVSRSGRPLGCGFLAARVREISPTLHGFGHVHNSAGHIQIGQTTYVNATSVDSDYVIAHPPFVFDLPL